MARVTELRVNRNRRRVDADSSRSLLSVLRDDLDLTGAKYGCGEGQCGACTVLLEGQPARACITSVSAAAGKSITTIEGLAQNGHLHPLQEAFLEAGAFQCGYCTSGMILSGVALLRREPSPRQRRNPSRHARQHLPVRHLPAHRGGHPPGCAQRRPSVNPSRFEPERYELNEPPAYRFEVDRRGFLGSAGAGILVALAAPAQESGRRGGFGQNMPQAIGAWLHIAPDSSITVYTGKVEVGQKYSDFLSQAVAEECCPALFRAHGHGRYRLDPFRYGHLRKPDHADDEPANSPGRRCRP